MAIKTWNATALTGGATRALDAIAISSLTDGDRAFVVASGKLYVYEFDSSATDAESSPDYIRPDDYATAGVWVNIVSPIDSEMPVGTIIAWPTSTAPSGYRECNGDAVSRTETYDSLFAVIGITYGSGDTTTTFNLPDLRGVFLRGWDHGAGVDDDAATRTTRGDVAATTGDNVGTVQDHAFQTHTHTTYNTCDVDPDTCGSNNVSLGSNGQNAASWATTAPTGVISATETRPINKNVMYCIKY